MPILAQTVHTKILSALDAEDSDRYLFDKDTKNAMNYAIGVLVTWFNSAFGQNKIAPESLREITKVKIWQANSYSRVSFNDSEVGHKMWTLLTVYPTPTINKKSITPSGGTNSASKFRPDVSLVEAGKPAKRLTLEEWGDNEGNAFMPGNNVLKGDMAEYAYLDFADYTSSSYVGNSDPNEITIRPSVANKFIAMGYLKYPSQVSLISDSIEFPESLTDLFVEIALNKISEKQGDNTNLYSVSAQNINKLTSLMR